MLISKPDSPDYRLVTDFAALNVYIKRVPNTSATIAQARARIARANYVVHLDLANYFYQCGMQHDDIQYLGTVHPYKGLRVYTCDPQGLKGASERSYEKLLRIYGDMIQDNRLAQMADGLHVLGMTVDELIQNYQEVLRRADVCNLTFKPSKVVICPKTINLFGWVLSGHEWLPSKHILSALTAASPPKTVKQLRSFLGSFKQLNASLPKYAETIHELEKAVAGRNSSERLNWTDTLNESFNAAKKLANNPVGIAEPRPTDLLRTYSDYSAETKAIGGRLTILRPQSDGTTKELVGGFFSAVLSKHKRKWLPCEGEAAAIRLVLEHFKNHIRESNHTTIHYTDSMPCVLAWKRSLKGAFSASARIATFLTGLSSLPVELHHKPGVQMHTSDYASRHPTKCLTDTCQICKFVQEWEETGDLASNIRNVTVEDIKSGRMLMPLTQRSSWKNIQFRDSVHCKLRDLITTQQLPETRKTNGLNTKLKLLHNKYTEGSLFIDSDGMFMLRTPEGKFNGSAISVPPAIYPGLVSALHIQLDHPSRGQLASLLNRYFYTPGGRAVIDAISDGCIHCAAIKKLPKVLLQDSTDIPHGMASHFAADVIERANQKILVLKENMSSFVRASLIPDQKATTLQDSLLTMLIDLIPESGATVRVDSAPAFQTLSIQCKEENSILKKFNIKIELGRTLNKNKNPTAEICNQELQKEILKITGKNGPVTNLQLATAVRNINSRIRYNGLSSKEVMFRRNLLDNQPIHVDDSVILDKMSVNRHQSSQSSMKSKAKTHSLTPNQQFAIGDLVFIREGKNKNSPRELYIVEDFEGKFILIRKFNSKLRQRIYKSLAEELIKAPNTPDNEQTTTSPALTPAGRPLREAAKKALNVSEVATLRTKAKNNHLLKPGWIPEDQDFEDVLMFSLPHMSTTSQIASTTSETSSDTSSHGSDQDLSWDSSPEQYSLTPSPTTGETVRSVPHSPSLRSHLSRRHAVSDNVLSRSNAFKHPPDTPPPAPVIRTQTFVRSRIPRPSSIADVDLHQVNDISLLPDPSTTPYNLRDTAHRNMRRQNAPRKPDGGRDPRRK